MLAVVLVLATVVLGSAFGVVLACAGDIPEAWRDATRPAPREAFAPTYLDGMARRDITVWEDGTPTDTVEPWLIDGDTDSLIDAPASGAAP